MTPLADCATGRIVPDSPQRGGYPMSEPSYLETPQGRKLLDGARLVGAWFGTDPRFVTAPAIASPRH